MKKIINKVLLEVIEKGFHGLAFGVGMSIGINKFKNEEESKKKN
jgi:hypothetical protein